MRKHLPDAVGWFARLCACICVALQLGAADRRMPGGRQQRRRLRVGRSQCSPVLERALVEEPYVVFFGFTHIPDVCPTTLLEMNNNLQRLGPDGDRLRVVFISIDPQRDTPAQLESTCHRRSQHHRTYRQRG